MQKDIYKTN